MLDQYPQSGAGICLRPALIVCFATCAPVVQATFTDVTVGAGLDHVHYTDDLPIDEDLYILTAGAAAADYDGDGWVDLYVTRLGLRDILYRNLGATRDGSGPWFEDVTLQAGLSRIDNTSGPAWGDIDNDGDLDLYVSSMNSARFYLYINQGDGTFEEEAIERGADLSSETLHRGFSVTFGDYNLDGFLDIHTCEWEIRNDSADLEQHSVLLMNRGLEAPGHFENVTAVAGVQINKDAEYQYAFASAFSDLDDDGWPDLAVASDFGTSQLFWNNGDGTFSEETDRENIGQGGNEMGHTIADYDGDGDLDWFVTSTQYDNRFYQNQGNRNFEEIAVDLNLDFASDGGEWSWATVFFDRDNDGDLDLASTNGWHPYNYQELNVEKSDFATQSVFWRNDDGVFVHSANTLPDMGEGKALLWFDYDRDGDLDLFIANNKDRPVLYRNNDESGNAWFRLDLVGTESNRQGIGAKVYVVANEGDPVRYFERTGISNFVSQNEPIVHVGLGSQTTPVHEVTIRWPNGREQIINNLALNQTHTIVEPIQTYTYAEWLELYFTAEEQADPAITGLSADPDGDRIQNKWEYLGNYNPLTFDTEGSLEIMPVEGQFDICVLEHSLASYVTGVTLIYEQSSDLINWSTINPIAESKTDGALRDTVSLTFQGGNFARVRLNFE